MTDDAPPDLAAGFEPVTREAWLALVDKATKGADFEKRLVSKTADGLRIEPLYMRGDRTTASDRLVSGDAQPSREAPEARSRPGWDIRTIVIESDPAAANAAILEDLEGGATSIAVQIAPDGHGLPATAEALGAALSGVILDMCPIALIPFEAFRGAAESLDAAWAERGVAPEKRLGAYGADPLGTLGATGGLAESIERALASAAGLAKAARQMPGVTALLADGVPYHNAGASEAQELAAMLAAFVAYLRACEAGSLSPQDALPKIAVALAADADQFLTIAKFRAARRLIWRVASMCGAGDAAAKIHVAAATSYRMMARRDPWTNILRGAMACSGAALGGADAICVLPFTFSLGKPDSFARRIARNTQLVLQEESHLGRVADPASGSWYIETLTHALAAKAWALFQDIEARGGMAAALTSGFIQDEIAKTAEARAKDISTRRAELTGVSAYPKLGGDGVTVEPWPRVARPAGAKAVAVKPLRPARLAEPFEALRDAAEGVHAASVLDSPPPNLPRKGGGIPSSRDEGTPFSSAYGGNGAAASIGGDLPGGSRDAIPPPLRGRLEPAPDLIRGGGESQTSEAGTTPRAKSEAGSNPSPREGEFNRPRVFLAALGAVADHSQRSTWTQNLLAAGGIEAPSSDGYATPAEAAEAFRASGATIACLASSDAIYEALAEETARRIKTAGARHVFMAGRPGERENALRAAGVDGFLFGGQDIVAALRGLHEMLGIGH